MELQPEILVVGGTAQSSLELRQWLEKRGCRCHFASSCKEACRLISGFEFDFVLSHFELPDRTAYPLLEKLIGSATTLSIRQESKTAACGCQHSRREGGGQVLKSFARTNLPWPLEGHSRMRAPVVAKQPPIPPIETEATRFANLKSLG